MADRKKSDPDDDAPQETDMSDDLHAETTEEDIAPPDETTEIGIADAMPQDEVFAAEEPEQPAADSPAPAADPAAPPASAGRSGVFLPAVLGGILAAALGFAAGRAPDFDRFLPGFLQSGTADALSALRSSDSQQADALAELQARPVPDLSGLEAAAQTQAQDIADVKSSLTGLGTDISALSGRLDAIETRLTELEKRPLAENVSAAARDAYERELAALRTEIQAMVQTARNAEAQARTREDNAAHTATLAQNRATVARLRAALNDGAPTAPILAELSAAGVSVPGDLATALSADIDTTAALISEFPPAARAALAADRDVAAGSGGIAAFFQRQLGARSVEPRDGDSTDAILSRAEAATVSGDLGAALAEIATLPPPAQAEMEGWAARATARNRAIAAVDTLAQSLNSN